MPLSLLHPMYPNQPLLMNLRCRELSTQTISLTLISLKEALTLNFHAFDKLKKNLVI